MKFLLVIGAVLLMNPLVSRLVSAQDDCELSLTTVGGKRACRNSVIFDYRFLTKINQDKWTVENFIPSYENSGGDMIFNYFDEENLSLKDGALRITPKIQPDDFVRRGNISFDSKCTGTTTNECTKMAQYQWILPPVSTGRLSTKNSFSFKYGQIEIHAKVPVGDWLIPEMWLVPERKVYGPGLESGRMIMFSIRGNRALFSNETNLGQNVLESHLLMSSGGSVRARTLRVKTPSTPWSRNFNKYLFTWRPNEIIVSVNDVFMGYLLPKTNQGTIYNMVGFSDAQSKQWLQGSAMAPFDEEFYLSLGLSVGGRDFPDGSVSNTYTKPWKARTVKEMLNFWRAKDKWEPTWDPEDSIFKILRVRIRAL